MPIRILILDPYAIARVGLIQTLTCQPEFEVVGESASLDDASTIISVTQPDVLIVDPKSDGDWNSLSAIHYEFPSLRTLVFTFTDDLEVASKSKQCGAAGYLIKASKLNELALAVRCVHEGRVFISHSQTRLPTPSGPKTLSRNAVRTSDVSNDPETLSARESEVLRLIAEGMTNKQAAATLYLSVKTVETYRSRIMKKFQLSDRLDLIKFARSSA